MLVSGELIEFPTDLFKDVLALVLRETGDDLLEHVVTLLVHGQHADVVVLH